MRFESETFFKICNSFGAVSDTLLNQQIQVQKVPGPRGCVSVCPLQYQVLQGLCNWAQNVKKFSSIC